VPVAVDGRRMSPATLLAHLNRVGGENGIGRVDMVENRLVGMKSRGVYETPGGTLLYAAHRELESLCLDRDTLHFKQSLALAYAELVYYGKWFTSLRQAMQGFIQQTQVGVSGWTRLKLYKGSLIVLGRHSPHSLYREDFATFGQDDVYNQSDAEGFINLFGLQMKVKAMLEARAVRPAELPAPDFAAFKRD